MNNTSFLNPLHPKFSVKAGERTSWGRLYGSSFGLVIKSAAQSHAGPLVIITNDSAEATRLEYELKFYIGQDQDLPILTFPDWETLPYDVFSPHQDIISERLATLYQLPDLQRGILIVPITTLMVRLAPREFLESNSLVLEVGQTLDIERLRQRLDTGGYQYVSAVYEHGEFAVRGSLVDLFPMGSSVPYRIDLFDNEVESIRTFDPETQRSMDKVDQIRLLPAKEFSLNEQGIAQFRQAFRTTFEGDPQATTIYKEVSKGIASAGIEYYLPLFFSHTSTLFDYLPAQSLLLYIDGMETSADKFWQTVNQRYEQLRHNIERPLLKPGALFLQTNEVFANQRQYPQVRLQHFELEDGTGVYNFATATPPKLTLDIRAPHPTDPLKHFIDSFDGRILFVAETTGRRETLLELLRGCDLYPVSYTHWQTFLEADTPIGIAVAPLEKGLLLDDPRIAVIAEPQLFGEQAMQRRRRKAKTRDADAVVRNLAELNIGSPVVHEDHGVGRYLGLQKLKIGDIEAEYLTLEYAGGDKLYVPVSSLHLISRYTGTAPDQAPLHKLGSGQWERAKRKASEKVRDVAAELLEIYARREARKGFAYPIDEQYSAFATTFPFEETPDQEEAIHGVLADMRSERPMDRLVCGDVGFGKTEVAIRAAFIAVQAGKQVAILVPTTLLAQQHYQNFKDRFADWPIRWKPCLVFAVKRNRTKSFMG